MVFAFWEELVISFRLFFFFRAVTDSSTAIRKGGVTIYLYAL